jgi:anaerobic selenocysteine-containing dehydrogenase
VDLHSVCALDCPDCCSLVVRVENGRATRLRGDPAQPVTRGFLCAKVARYLEREYSPDRLLHPLKREGAKGEGRFRPISWDEALDEIANRLQAVATEFGSEAVLPYSYAGTMGKLNGSGMDRRFFHRLGASRLDRTICSSTGGAALAETIGKPRFGTDPEQIPAAKLILAWGANILGTNVHYWPFIVEARRKGAKFYTIDPVKNRTGQCADKHFFINPGSDAALALSLMHVLIGEGLEDRDYIDRYTEGFEALRERVREYPPERGAALTGIPAGEIVALAREYGTLKPSLIRLNYGVQRSERGGLSVRAISLLPALTGAWREPGGGLLLSTSGAFQLNEAALERADLQWRVLGRQARLVNMAELGKALTELDGPPVKAMVVYNSNPAAIAPNQNRVRQGLARPDLFTVVLEQFQTDTADWADIVLPVTTFLEHTDLYFAYGHYYLQLARPALPAAGEAKSNVEIFRLLAKRMGLDEPALQETDDQMIRAALDSPHPFLRGITLEQLDREHFVRLKVGAPFVPYAEGGFATPSGKCEFHADTLDYEPPIESRHGDPELRRRYPLELVTPKADEGTNSTFGNRPEVDASTAVLSMNSADAAPRLIASGDPVRVFNGRGQCSYTAEVDGAVPPGVVRARSVRWSKLAPGGGSANALTSDRLTDQGGGPVFYSCLVEVERCAG